MSILELGQAVKADAVFVRAKILRPPGGIGERTRTEKQLQETLKFRTGATLAWHPALFCVNASCLRNPVRLQGCNCDRFPAGFICFPVLR